MKVSVKSHSSNTWNRIVAQHLRRRERAELKKVSSQETPQRPRFNLFLASFRR
ncbi:MAG: hypothetical protein RL020_96 [Pseudomonadota bacterium]|jgi:uncharacterized protein YjiS (DUF1127 family)